MSKITILFFLLFSAPILSTDITQLPENYRKIILPLLAALPKAKEAKNNIITELEEYSEFIKSQSTESEKLKIHKLYQKIISVMPIQHFIKAYQGKKA